MGASQPCRKRARETDCTSTSNSTSNSSSNSNSCRDSNSPEEVTGEFAAAPCDDGPGEGWLRLEESDSLLVQGGGRAHARLGAGSGGDRFVTVLSAGGQLRAFDAICYHAGGPLGLGDIEEIGPDKLPCVSCPWHHYLIDLETGSKWYQPLRKDESSGKLVHAGWKSSEKPVQRVHEVKEHRGSIFVRLQIEGSCESDSWSKREDCIKSMQGLARQHHGGARSGAIAGGADGKMPPRGLPSGQVLRQAAVAAAGAGGCGCSGGYVGDAQRFCPSVRGIFARVNYARSNFHVQSSA
ncbi:unnamed protein product [Polarella glacialis]|uniref:Rieske domain-containing protein n=1 Tax=Polarella glacialis TaxID=89957 RepID=A0A813E015_POLGL|nr:unnamed protein product [Polarella glacialis]